MKNSDHGLGYLKTAIEFDGNLGEAYYFIAKIHLENKNHNAALMAFEKAEELGYNEATIEIELMHETSRHSEIVGGGVEITGTEHLLKITKQAIKYAHKERQENPKIRWRTAARLAVDKFFPDLRPNARAKKIDSIRNTIKQMGPHRIRSNRK
jgi:hypothetical protein